MDLGIAGRKAIVCASSRGPGAPAPTRLAEAGCEVVVNGRDPTSLENTAEDIRKATRPRSTPWWPTSPPPRARAKPFAACPEPDILITNNAGPPFRDFRELDREKMIAGAIGNMIVPIELIQKVIDPMVHEKFGRIVNITSGSVKMPLVGLDLSSGARAGLDRVPRRRIALGRAAQRHHQLPAAGPVRHRPLRHGLEITAKKQHHDRAGRGQPRRVGTGQAPRQPGRVRRGLRVPVLAARRIHHRAEPADGRRHFPGAF